MCISLNNTYTQYNQEDPSLVIIKICINSVIQELETTKEKLGDAENSNRLDNTLEVCIVSKLVQIYHSVIFINCVHIGY